MATTPIPIPTVTPTFSSYLNVWRGPNSDPFEAYYGYFLTGAQHPAVAGADLEGIAPGSILFQPGSPAQNQLSTHLNEAVQFGTTYTGYGQANLDLLFPFYTPSSLNPDKQVDYDLFRLGTAAGTYRVLVSTPKLYEMSYGYNDGVLTTPTRSSGQSSGTALNPQIWLDIEVALAGQPVRRVWQQSNSASTITISAMQSDGARGNYVDAVVKNSASETVKGVYLVLDNDTSAYENFAFFPASAKPAAPVGDSLAIQIQMQDGFNAANIYQVDFEAYIGLYKIDAVQSLDAAQTLLNNWGTEISTKAEWSHVISSNGQYPNASQLSGLQQVGPNNPPLIPPTEDDLAPIPHIKFTPGRDKINLNSIPLTSNQAIVDAGAGLDQVNVGKSSSAVVGYDLNSTTGASALLMSDQSLYGFIGVERIAFTDGILATDINGNAGQTYRVYQAAFARTPDTGGLSFWVHRMDTGTSLRDLASAFLTSNEFKSIYGTAPTNTEIVSKLYQNVLGRAGEKAGIDFWVGLLSTGTSRADMLVSFSESPENISKVGSAINKGIELDLTALL